MKNIFDGHAYGATWGITCFYDDCEEIFQQAINSGEDFLADWGAKKEIVYATVERTGDETRVEVRSYIDELPQLVDTAVWRAFGGNEFSTCGFDAIRKLHDLDATKDREKIIAILEEIEDGVRDIYSEEFTAEKTLPRNAPHFEIVETLENLQTDVDAAGQQCYDDIVEYIRIWWDSIQEQADMNNGRFA